VVATARIGGKPAVVTTVTGRAWITSIGLYGNDPDDPFPEGYTLSDTWLQAI
jgi:proline racemase